MSDPRNPNNNNPNNNNPNNNRNYNQDATQNVDLNKQRGNNVRFKVMKDFDWKEEHKVPGTDSEPVFVWMTADEAKDHIANGNIVAA